LIYLKKKGCQKQGVDISINYIKQLKIINYYYRNNHSNTELPLWPHGYDHAVLEVVGLNPGHGVTGQLAADFNCQVAAKTGHQFLKNYIVFYDIFRSCKSHMKTGNF